MFPFVENTITMEDWVLKNRVYLTNGGGARTCNAVMNCKLQSRSSDAECKKKIKSFIES